MRKKYLLIIVLLIILAGFFVFRIKIKNLWLDLTKEKLPEPIEYQNVDESKTEDRRLKTEDQRPKTEDRRLKTEDQISESPSAADSQAIGFRDDKPTASINLNVPFTPQAPMGIWNETFKEACEEAASLMAHYYYQGKEFTPEIATAEILKMVDWQIENWGGHFDLTAKQTVEMIKQYWNYEKVEVIDNPTIDEIKRHLSEKRPVIVPVAGRELGNPYFRQPGPVYHMLVIKGYTADKFITNDPGTKRGKDFLYDYDVVMNAMHDWDEDDINQGEKRIMVIYPVN